MWPGKSGDKKPENNDRYRVNEANIHVHVHFPEVIEQEEKKITKIKIFC